jgi:hypothetical protein
MFSLATIFMFSLATISCRELPAVEKQALNIKIVDEIMHTTLGMIYMDLPWQREKGTFCSMSVSLWFTDVRYLSDAIYITFHILCIVITLVLHVFYNSTGQHRLCDCFWSRVAVRSVQTDESSRHQAHGGKGNTYQQANNALPHVQPQWAPEDSAKAGD